MAAATLDAYKDLFQKKAFAHVATVGPEGAPPVEVGDSFAMRPTEPDPQQALPFPAQVSDAPLCAECGSLMVPNGSCFKCVNCGGTSGCS